jgi:PAS domain S-box-containing protein
VLHGVLERAVTLLQVAGGELATWDPVRQDLEIVASHNMGTNAVGTRMALGEGAMGQVAETSEPLVIPRYQEWISRSAKYTQSVVQTVMAVPLLIGSRLVGVIAAVHSEPDREFGEDDQRLLELFAPQAAIAIENARLFTESRRQKQYFEELVSNSPVAIVTLDTLHDVVSCNPAFEKLFGYTADEIRGRNLDDLITTPETRVDCPEEKKFEIVEQMTAYFKAHYDALDIDGVRILFGDGWGLIRASNTQPVLVLRFEAQTPERLQEIQEIVLTKLHEFAPEVEVPLQ